jgi:5-formyltetrahydrofolate cyclo-ligase
MLESLRKQKAALRANVRGAVKPLSSIQRHAASRAIRERILARQEWHNAASVLLFAPMADEPDIWPLLELALSAGKRVALPRFDRGKDHYEAAVIQDAATDVVVGKFNIREPASGCKAADLNRLDLALVPGVAFDRQGRRLGRGGGFYDRLLAAVSGTTCGVAFDEQLVATIPVEPHDVQLNCILAPSHWLES